MKKIKNIKQRLFENMVKLNPDFKLNQETLNEADEKWIQKAINPEHKGYCTPMSKPTCTPKRKALAKRFKKGIEDESYGRPDPLGANMAKPMNEDEMQQNSSIQYRAEVAGVRENVWSTNAKVFNSEEEAKAYLDDLGSRWFGFDMSRVVPVTTPQGEQVDFADPKIYQNYRKK